MAPPPPAALARRLSAEEQAAMRALPDGPGHELVLGSCLSCHAAAMITQQHKDTAGWNKTITQMVAWGAPVTNDQQATLVAYLVEHYPARAAGGPAQKAP
jgi:cytochrome c5